MLRLEWCLAIALSYWERMRDRCVFVYCDFSMQLTEGRLEHMSRVSAGESGGNSEALSPACLERS